MRISPSPFLKLRDWLCLSPRSAQTFLNTLGGRVATRSDHFLTVCFPLLIGVTKWSSLYRHQIIDDVATIGESGKGRNLIIQSRFSGCVTLVPVTAVVIRPTAIRRLPLPPNAINVAMVQEKYWIYSIAKSEFR